MLRLLTTIKIHSDYPLLNLAVLATTLLTASNVQSSNGFPRKEFPFCPGGGPPGWMNYFDYQQDKTYPGATDGINRPISVLITRVQSQTLRSIIGVCLTIIRLETLPLSSNTELDADRLRQTAHAAHV